MRAHLTFWLGESTSSGSETYPTGSRASHSVGHISMVGLAHGGFWLLYGESVCMSPTHVRCRVGRLRLSFLCMCPLFGILSLRASYEICSFACVLHSFSDIRRIGNFHAAQGCLGEGYILYTGVMRQSCRNLL